MVIFHSFLMLFVCLPESKSNRIRSSHDFTTRLVIEWWLHNLMVVYAQDLTNKNDDLTDPNQTTWFNMIQPTMNPDLMGYLHDTPLQVDGINMALIGNRIEHVLFGWQTRIHSTNRAQNVSSFSLKCPSQTHAGMCGRPLPSPPPQRRQPLQVLPTLWGTKQTVWRDWRYIIGTKKNNCRVLSMPMDVEMWIQLTSNECGFH